MARANKAICQRYIADHELNLQVKRIQGVQRIIFPNGGSLPFISWDAVLDKLIKIANVETETDKKYKNMASLEGLSQEERDAVILKLMNKVEKENS